MVGSLTCDYIQYGSYGCSGYINLIIFVIVFTSSFDFHSSVEHQLILIGELS